MQRRLTLRVGVLSLGPVREQDRECGWLAAHHSGMYRRVAAAVAGVHIRPVADQKSQQRGPSVSCCPVEKRASGCAAVHRYGTETPKHGRHDGCEAATHTEQSADVMTLQMGTDLEHQLGWQIHESAWLRVQTGTRAVRLGRCIREAEELQQSLHLSGVVCEDGRCGVHSRQSRGIYTRHQSVSRFGSGPVFRHHSRKQTQRAGYYHTDLILGHPVTRCLTENPVGLGGG